MKDENEKSKKKYKKFAILLVLIYIVFVLSIILRDGLSKFSTTYSTNSTAKIATPIINIVNEQEHYIIEDLHNQEISYNFKVTNYNSDSEINAVLLAYDLEISLGKDINNNIEYKLYKINGNVENKISLVDGLTNENFKMSFGEKQEDSYCLRLKTLDNTDIAGIEDNISISLTAVQQIN